MKEEPQTETPDTEEAATVANSFDSLVSKTFCGTCDGLGRIRANTIGDRGYQFRKATCPECDGTGKGDTTYC